MHASAPILESQWQTQFPEVPSCFTTIEELRRQFSSQYHHLRNQEVLALPEFPLKNDRWNQTIFPENFVFTLPRGRIYGRHGIGITSGNKVILDTLQAWQRSKADSLFAKDMPNLELKNERVAILALNGAASYYHWMFELLPRLKLLIDSQVPFDKIYIPSILFPFQKETLRKCGIYEDQIIQGYDETYLEVAELIIPSLITTECCTHPLWACEFLRSTFLESSLKEIASEKKLLILRKNFTSQSKRRLINDVEIFEFLQSKGFEKVFLEDLTVLEQAILFASAKVVVAAHGAGLTNIVFCKPGTQVIEVFHPDHLDETFWFLSGQLQLKHECLLPSTASLTPEQNENCDIYLPLELLSQLR